MAALQEPGRFLRPFGRLTSRLALQGLIGGSIVLGALRLWAAETFTSAYISEVPTGFTADRKSVV